MHKPWLHLALAIPALLAGCGGNVGSAPPAPVISFPGQLPSPPDAPPDTPAVTSLKGQLWHSTGTSGVQRRVVVLDDLSFLGWWMEPAASGPPAYGLFSGGLQPQASNSFFATPDMVAMRLPYGLSTVGNVFSMTSPQASETQVVFDADSDTMRADAHAQEVLSIAQRSGRYAGELQLPGRREPVNLQWDAAGALTLSLTSLAANNCGATGQASPLAGAPAGVLAFTLSFSGAGCPTVNGGASLSGITVSGEIDASSADAFVLFGVDGLRSAPLLLPAARAPAPALQGAWTGVLDAAPMDFHVAVLDDLSLLGWFHDPSQTPPAYGLVLSTLQPPAPGATSFGGGQLQTWTVPVQPVTVPVANPGFAGPLPVSDSMSGYFGWPATMHAVPIAQQALPMAQRSGRYAGVMRLPGLQLATTLVWGADGSLSLSLSDWPACTAAGQAGALVGGPARWLSFHLGFSGAGCPTTSNHLNLSGVEVQGGVDAASGDAFMLFGSDNAHQTTLLLPATRQ